MSDYELMQWLALAGGVVVVGAGIYGFWRFSKKLDALWPETATKYGLVYEQSSTGSALTNSSSRQVLSGPAMRVESTREHVGRMKRTSTVISVPVANAPPGLSFDVARQRPPSSLHLVKTDDSRFDALRFVTSGQADATRALLSPAVRAALLKCPQWSLRVASAERALVVSFGDAPLDTESLHGPIELAKALAEVSS